MRRALTAVVSSLALAAGALPAEPIDPERLFRPPVLSHVTSSPSGVWIATRWDEEDQTRLTVRHRETGNTQHITSDRGLGRYWWVGSDTLLMRIPRPEGVRIGPEQHSLVALRFSYTNEKLEFERKLIVAKGVLVAPLPHAEEEVLWQVSEDEHSSVYRVDVETLSERSGRRRNYALISPNRVAEISGSAWSWVVDGDGTLRATSSVERGDDDLEYVLRYRDVDADDWEELQRTGDFEEVIHPLGMAGNGRDLLVAAHAGRDTLGLHEYDVQARDVTRTHFVADGADVQWVVMDYTASEPLAVAYSSRGQTVYHYFDEFRDRYQRSLEHAFPGRNVHVVSTSADGRVLVAIVADARSPGTYYVLDTTTNRASELGDRIPGLPIERLRSTEAFVATSRDGTRVEAFLTLPERAPGALAPLVVMPHGGPIGVQDDRDFDPLVQLLATSGMAVLKVNYRGSGGYGREFLEAGKRAWSRGIEDDVDAAVAEVLARGDVDATRVCIVGASYGGYSALASVIRHPQRYRCAASLAGPSDVLLLFESTDFAMSDEGREWLVEVLGDPEVDREELISISPAYSAHRIEAPLLIAHGTDDHRVDIEHAYRLRLMLDAHGKRYDWLELTGAGHDLSYEQSILFSGRLRGFLSTHLGLGAPDATPVAE